MQKQGNTRKYIDVKDIESSFKATLNKKATIAKHGMVSTAFPNATKAGVQMLKKGGNAIDAACASALALAVCEPQASGLGGQTIALIHVNGKTIAIDGSSRVPSLAHSTKFKKNEQFIGYKATTVPSTVATIGYLNEHYGRLDWQDIIKPAIIIAKRGYKITKLQHNSQVNNLEKFFKVRSRSGAKYFLKDGQIPYNIGDRFVQGELSDTLNHLSKYGYYSFYHGKIADQINKDMRKNKGFLRKQDLSFIPQPIEKRPISKRYRGIKIYTIPPPGAGETMLLVMMMLSNIPKKYLTRKNVNTYHYISETFRKALLYRTQRPFDPKTYHQIKDEIHLSRNFAKTLSNSIKDSVDPTLPPSEPSDEIEDTTHLSVMDDEGNIVSMTQSIELVYGSKAAAEGLGFLYNNYMSAFELENPKHPFFLRPNATPWSSVCPSIVFYNNKPWMAVGSPGSDRIFSTMSLFLSRLIDEGDSIYTAMQKPRIHCSLGGTISVEADNSITSIIKHLKEKGYNIDKRERYSFYLGAIHAVLKNQTKEGFQGVAEIRRDGTADGP